MLAKVLPFTLIGSLLCLGIFQSVASVSETRTNPDTSINLKQRSRVEDNAPVGALLQNSDDFKKEEDVLTAQWTQTENCRTPEERKAFADVVAKLANLKQQEGAFEQAVYCYQILLSHDLKSDDKEGDCHDSLDSRDSHDSCDSRDSRVARDHLNTGLSYLLWQSTTTEAAQRSKLANQALDSFTKAEQIYSKNNQHQALYSVYVNKYQLLKDIGNTAAAQDMFAKIKAMDSNNGASSDRALFIKQG